MDDARSTRNRVSRVWLYLPFLCASFAPAVRARADGETKESNVVAVLAPAKASSATNGRLGVVLRIVNETHQPVALNWPEKTVYSSYEALLDSRTCENPLKTKSIISHGPAMAQRDPPPRPALLAPHEAMTIVGELDLTGEFFAKPGFYAVTLSYLLRGVGKEEGLLLESNQMIFEVPGP